MTVIYVLFQPKKGHYHKRMILAEIDASGILEADGKMKEMGIDPCRKQCDIITYPLDSSSMYAYLQDYMGNFCSH